MPDQDAVDAAAPIIATSAGPAAARFRWGIIPATFSWVMGGTTAVAIPFAIVAVALSLPEISDSKHFASFIGGIVFQFISAAIYSAFWIWAGYRWLSGRWRSALAFNLAGYGVVAGIYWVCAAAGLYVGR